MFQDVCSEMPTVYIKSWSVVNPIDMATTVRFHDGMTSDPSIDLYISALSMYLICHSGMRGSSNVGMPLV